MEIGKEAAFSSVFCWAAKAALLWREAVAVECPVLCARPQQQGRRHSSGRHGGGVGNRIPTEWRADFKRVLNNPYSNAIFEEQLPQFCTVKKVMLKFSRFAW